MAPTTPTQQHKSGVGQDANSGANTSAGAGGQANTKIVGPNIVGKKEEYRLERRLQSGLFGGVYEAKGLSSGRNFAVKVLHRSELQKASRASSFEFCEVPLSEVKYKDLMNGHENIMQVEDHFDDQYCHYIVFELARGGDLLEALKLRPHGFEEHEAQFLIGQAARGLSELHRRRLAMQDVSLENMLIHILDDGRFQVKVCDPGQAALFRLDSETGEELPVEWNGFVGKSFRPHELLAQAPYLASKVDAWCLGWSTFYLLAAQPLFLSADPKAQDADWVMFQQGNFEKLWAHKLGESGAGSPSSPARKPRCSQKAMDFILRLLDLDPQRRMSVTEALQHEWLTDSRIRPMYGPRELQPPKVATPTSPERRVAALAAGATDGYSPPQERENGGRRSLSSAVGGGVAAVAASVASVGSASVTGTGPPSAHRQSKPRNSNASASGVGGATAGTASANNSNGVLVWQRAPPSRSESPGLRGASPYAASVGIRGPTAAAAGTAAISASCGGPPSPSQNRYAAASAQIRNASPFTASPPTVSTGVSVGGGSQGAGFAPTVHVSSGRSTSPPPRPVAAPLPAPRGSNASCSNAGSGTNGASPGRMGSLFAGEGALGLGQPAPSFSSNQPSLHTPYLGRPSPLMPSGQPSGNAAGSGGGSGVNTTAQSGSAMGSVGGSLQARTAASQDAPMVSDMAFGGDRFAALAPSGPGSAMGSGRRANEPSMNSANTSPHAAPPSGPGTAVPSASGYGAGSQFSSSGPRQTSPLPQAQAAGNQVVLRSPNGVRGYSPGPVRGGLGGLSGVPQWPQRPGSPMSGINTTSSASPGGRPSNGGLPPASAGVSLESAAHGGTLTSPVRGGAPVPAATPGLSPSATSEAYAAARGRSHTRTLSPATALNGYVASSPHRQAGSAGLQFRTTSPQHLQPRHGQPAAGFSWSPVPPSPQAPTRSVSPTPAGVVLPGYANTMVPRWGHAAAVN